MINQILFYLICYTLNPLDALFPLALSNFLPLLLTKGFECDPGTPGAPWCNKDSLSLVPLNRTTCSPVGRFTAS